MNAVPGPPHTSASESEREADRIVDWLLGGLEWNASVFHVGQYCGRWRASTAGHACASFHLILEGRCWLHFPGRAAVPLSARDGVFLRSDVPHFLSPYDDPGIDCAPRPMQPLSATSALGETGLACGFFSFDGPFRDLVLDAFPDCLVLRADDRTLASAAMLFDLMRGEAHRAGSAPSALMDRLAGLLFFYGLRHVARDDARTRGLWALLRRPGFAPLVAQLLQAPERAWTVDVMARHVHLSRAAFFRQFAQACGQSPLQFLQLLRMQVAMRRLAQGESIAQVAQAVGYDSYAAFSRAFKRLVGAQPGAWQRTRTIGHKAATPGH
jgi:AraC family transcriptional activator of mtrCDE